MSNAVLPGSPVDVRRKELAARLHTAIPYALCTARRWMLASGLNDLNAFFYTDGSPVVVGAIDAEKLQDMTEATIALLQCDIPAIDGLGVIDGGTPVRALGYGFEGVLAEASRIEGRLVEIEAPTLILPPELSDDALALDFAERGAEFRWSHSLGWMLDDGTTWARDENMQRYDVARRICREAASQCEEAGEAKRVASARTVNAVLTMAQSDPRIVVPLAFWDADPFLMNTPAGIVNLRTGELRSRSGEYVTQCTRVAPKAGSCPHWSSFLNAVFLADAALIEFMQRSMGYWLTGDRREQILHFFYGLGANGKSVLIDLIQWIAGTYALKLPAATLMQSKTDRHPTELAQLRGKRLAVSSELDESSFFNESLIKELTGDATLTARFMRGDFFEFVMSQKHVIVGNFKPRLRGGDPAMARRLLLVPFNASFKGSARDPLMLDKLKAEAPAILDWMIAGAVKWAQDGLAVPESVRNASAEYMADHDDLQLWIDQCCELTGEARAGDLYRSFSIWKKDRGEHAPSQTVWGSRLSSLPNIHKRRSNGIQYTGIRLSEMEARRAYDL